MIEKNESKVAGGVARAKNLSPMERSDIAKKAAAVRWKDKVKYATHGSSDNPLTIGDIHIPCYVLADGTRVLSQRGLQGGIGMSRSGGSGGEQRIAKMMDVLEEKGLDTKDLAARIKSPIEFCPPTGGRSVYGFEATILADICDVILDARNQGVLHNSQVGYADRCELLVRGFARVGIIALIDEATGFQKDRARDALSKILEAFVAKELRPWVPTFPSEYYEHLFRLRGLEFPTLSVKKPSYFGHLTNNIVYDRLAPKVKEELKNQTPRDNKGRHKHQLHRRLTGDVGHPKLREHLASVITLMKISEDYGTFEGLLDRVHPKFNETLALGFD